MSNSSDAWSWRHAFTRSNLPATTRLVLHTIGMYMNELGEGCYPSVANICETSGLDKKTVLKHLGIAREAGWITVSQHGFRGQRWKRQEYAARWPDRDLISGGVPVEENEGGGAVPPALKADKVVELVPEGGGIEGSKVVEQLHQDKNSPITSPVTSPIEREAREENSKKESKKDLENSFWLITKDWPNIKGMPSDKWFKAWCALSAEERLEAAEKRDAWLSVLKSNGRTFTPVPGTYFQQKLWKDVPDNVVNPDGAAATRKISPPFGKLWGAGRMAVLLAGAKPTTRPSSFIENMIKKGGETGERYRKDWLSKAGYPVVVAMHEQANNRRGYMVDDAYLPLEDEMEQVRVGSDLWAEWQELHEAKGWLWFDESRVPKWIWFPKGGVAGLVEFEAKFAEVRNDDAR